MAVDPLRGVAGAGTTADRLGERDHSVRITTTAAIQKTVPAINAPTIHFTARLSCASSASTGTGGAAATGAATGFGGAIGTFAATGADMLDATAALGGASFGALTFCTLAFGLLFG